MNLFEINNQIENFEFEFDELTGEVLNLEELDELKLTRDEKIENIALFIKNLKADEKALDDEIKSLKARMESKSRKIDNLSRYLEITLGNNKFESPKCKVSWWKSKQVVIDDEKQFIDQFSDTSMVTRKVDMKINKTEVKKYLQENKCSIAHIEEKQNLQIK